MFDNVDVHTQMMDQVFDNVNEGTSNEEEVNNLLQQVCEQNGLKLADENDSPLIIENKLKQTFNKNDWIRLHHQFIHFGRYFCLARNPQCKNCKICDICKENAAKIK